MSRLLNPGLGDHLDRWTILTLKIADADQRGRSADHFRSELRMIERAILNHYWKYDPADADHLLELNTTLWRQVSLQAAASTRWPRVTEQEQAELAQSAIDTYLANEERARIVQQLNGFMHPEKTR